MRNSFGFMFYLAGLSMLGYLATDMYLPAFGAMREELQISAGAVSASLSIFWPASPLRSCCGGRSPTVWAANRYY